MSGTVVGTCQMSRIVNVNALTWYGEDGLRDGKGEEESEEEG